MLRVLVNENRRIGREEVGWMKTRGCYFIIIIMYLMML